MERELEILQGEQLMNYLESCVELSQNNKISIRNAFDISLIDQLISLSKDSPNDTERKKTNFSLASMSLQASGKVYGYRVDSVHLDTIRLVLELPKQMKRGSTDVNSPESVSKESKRVKRLRLSRFLADEGANDKPIDIDHFLCRNPVMETAHCNDSNALGRLMSYNLIPPENQGIDLEGNSPWWAGDRLEKVAPENRLIRVKKDLPLIIEGVELDFDVPETVDVKSEDDSVEFDPDTDPIPEVEGIAPVDIDDYDLEDSFNEKLDQPRFDNPGDLSSIYNHSFKSTGTNFAGPSNFRLKRYDILGAEKKSQRSSSREPQREPKYLSFDEIPAGLDDYVPDHTTWTELSHGTMEKWTKHANTLPVDFAPSSFARLAELFAFPNKPIPEDEPDEDNADHASNVHDDVDESSGFDEAFNDSGLGEDRFRISGSDENESEINVPINKFVEDRRFDTLISAPGILAESISVSYSKEARRLNMKQMKKSFWEVLTNRTASKTMVGEKSFREFFEEASADLTQKQKMKIDLPIAFFTTLALCNEKHLVLTPKENSADFVVSQAAVPRPSDETNEPMGRFRPRKAAS